MKKFIVSSSLAILIFTVCIVLSWHVLSSVNFFFNTLYDLHKIDYQIEKYAPQNRNRSGFELTNKMEHIRIFRELVSEINSNGAGLEAINYYSENNDKIDSFLTNAEVAHLTDVCMLIKLMNKFALIIGCILLALLLFTWTYKIKYSRYFWKPPNIWLSLLNMVLLILAAAGCILIIGPRAVFHKLHEWVFLNKSQWYFYYQDSLMTTLLPESIFGTISLLMAAFALLFWIIICYFTNKILL